ncbi:hypothetical protein OIU78_010899 [Salix suchowensis]|nr:hypothetical protein OIU78_010899 [Salix suchowensis]
MHRKLMAGTFSAINWKFPPLATLSLLNPQIPPFSRQLNSLYSYFNVIYARFAYGLILFLKLGFVDLAPRSGLTWKHSIDVGAGVIDADYRGPVGVILFNHSDLDFEVKVGDRIAQLIL